MAIKNKRRKAIEIYFVLYLSALILILPGKKADQTPANGSVDVSLFAVQAQKQELSCRYLIDSAGVRITLCDSINVISYAGSVEDVRFEFIIEDRNTNEKFRLSNDQKNSLEQYSLEDFPTKKQAIFKWTPRVQNRQNKSYNVKVTAFAYVQDQTLPDKRKPITAKTQFALNLQYDGENTNGGMGFLFRQSQQNQPPIDLNLYNPINSIALGEFLIEPRNKTVQALAGQRWENSVLVFGANPNTDFAEPAKIRIIRANDKSGGSAEITGITERSINIGGKAPENSEMKVAVSAIRKRDNKEITVEFKVRSQKITQADCDTVMIAGETYSINPNLPFVSSQESKAYLKDENRIYASSNDGSAFNFLPEKWLVGKTLYFERYFGDKMVDRTPVRIINYPAPEIFSFYREGSKAFAKIKTWRKIQNKENYSNIEIIEGSATFQNLYGKSQKNGAYIIETYEFILNDKKPLIIRAIDQIGGKSEVKKLN